jgi:hypothetical protein
MALESTCVASSTHGGRTDAADIFIGILTFSHQKLRPLVEQYAYHRDAAFCVQSTSAHVCHPRYLGLAQRLRARDLSHAHYIIEFLVLVELTKPSVIDMAWRKNIAIFVVICVIVFAIILYQRTVTLLH